MDLVIIQDAPSAHRELSQQASIATHQKYFGEGNIIFLHANTPWNIIGALRAAIRDVEISDDFILSRDSTFLLGPFDPVQAHCHEKSSYLTRKGADTSAMVGSIGYLMDAGFTTYDYEVAAPHVFNKSLLLSTLREIGASLQHVHTTYFNRLGFKPVRLKDPMIDQWTWHLKPEGPVVTLGPECYGHRDCQKWLKGLLDAVQA